jgi:hypothetical protein
MWRDEDLGRVADLRNLEGRGPVLSIYLSIDPRVESTLEERLKAPLQELRERLPEIWSESLADDVAVVLRFVREEYEPEGRTLVVMASLARGLFEVFELEIALPTMLRYEPEPYLVPLECAQENHPRVAIVALDQERARIFTTILGEVDHRESLKDPVPRRQRQGAWSAHKYERDRVRHVREHFLHVVEALEVEHASVPFKRIVLGGTRETVAGLIEELPRDLRALVAGQFAVELFASDSEIVERGLAVADEAERAEEADLLRTIFEEGHVGGHAVLGEADSLAALRKGQVHRLAIASRLLGTEIGDEALKRAWRTGVAIEFMEGQPEEDLLSVGGMAALTRY